MSRQGKYAATLLVGLLAFVVGIDVAVSRPEIKGRFAGSPAMTGAQVIPGPGDPDGGGEVVFQFRPPTRDNNKAMACAFLYLDDQVQDPFKVWIRKGRTGESGPIQLGVAVEGYEPRLGIDAQGCRFDLSPRQINAVRRHEKRYYAEVRTAEFPDGAVRGQIQQYTDQSEPK